ncbi:MAG: DUF547 domain-containing protein [Gammaproteobacteria bacterium]
MKGVFQGCVYFLMVVTASIYVPAPVYATPVIIDRNKTPLAAEVNHKKDTLHKLFDQILHKYVNNGRVDYAGIKTDQRYYDYLEFIKQTNPDSFTTKNEKIAFWINAYNALAIKGILEGLSPGSLLGRAKYFIIRDYEAGGRHINLYHLEREVLIPFADPRIHFAIVCAAVSCPKLRSEAYTAARLNQQLDEDARAFINNPEKNFFNIKTKTARLSKIFDWFHEGFEQHAGSVQKYILQYMEDPETAALLDRDGFHVKYLRYDWRLNDTL